MNKHAFARGHLCSAVWKTIDPERSWIDENNNSATFQPFSWIDAETLKEPLRNKFLHPDLRTEIIPCYSIEQSPLLSLGKNNEYSAENLAEIWNPTQLTDFFDPLLIRYKNWIDTQREKLESLPQDYYQIGKKHVELCDESLRRITEGITIICNNTEARLAFCFMNKVMNLQSMWKRSGRGLKWRPFQIAFILQCLSSIVIKDHPEREICDLFCRKRSRSIVTN